MLAILEKLFIAFRIITQHSMAKGNGFSTARIDGSSDEAAIGFSVLKTFAVFWAWIPDMFAKGWRNGEKRKQQNIRARLSRKTNHTPAEKNDDAAFCRDGFTELNGGQSEWTEIC